MLSFTAYNVNKLKKGGEGKHYIYKRDNFIVWTPIIYNLEEHKFEWGEHMKL